MRAAGRPVVAMDCVEFFRELNGAFASILAAGHDAEALIDRLANRAYDVFEDNVAIQTRSLPGLSCDKGCPSCCTLRVTATAPEIFLMARYIRLVDATPAGAALDLPNRIAEVHRATAGRGEQERMAQRAPCPLLLKGVCVIHPVRSLACRGLASFDREACAEAVAGQNVEVPLSEAHRDLRAIVQNALQSALRRAGLAWGLYELNQGLALALDAEDRRAAWARGGDSLAPMVPELDLVAMAATFDTILAD